MPTTIRDYRLVIGMDRYEAILELARTWLPWDGDTPRPSSLIVRVQHPDAPAYTQYAYECHSFERALSIVDDTYAEVRPGTLVRVEWNAPHYGWCDKCGDPLDAEGRCDYLRRHGES